MTAAAENGTGLDGPAFVAPVPELASQRHALDKMIRELGELIAEERANRVAAERAVLDSKERERRLLRALAALEGETTMQVARKASGPRGGKIGDWHISDKKCDDVFEKFCALVMSTGKPTTPTMLAHANPGLSPESSRRALDRLRGEERVRLAGKTRGGGRLFDLMPDTKRELEAARGA